MSKLELCISCDELTGRAGKGEDSLYRGDDTGPFCEDCFDTLQQGESVEPEQDLKANTELGEKLLSVWLDHCSEDASSGDETLMSDLEDGELLLEAIEALNTAQAARNCITCEQLEAKNAMLGATQRKIQELCESNKGLQRSRTGWTSAVLRIIAQHTRQSKPADD